MRIVEVWYDNVSEPTEPLYCVSLCEPDGSEVRCLSTHTRRDDAERSGRVEAIMRRITCLYREEDGRTTPVHPC